MADRIAMPLFLTHHCVLKLCSTALMCIQLPFFIDCVAMYSRFSCHVYVADIKFVQSPEPYGAKGGFIQVVFFKFDVIFVSRITMYDQLFEVKNQ